MEPEMTPGIYVHLPFCTVHCTYCDFPLTTRLSLSERYYRALMKELHQAPPEIAADTLYFGGGTPSLTPSVILQEIRNTLPLEDSAEITLEANPEHINPKNLQEWKEVGINRLSLGVQSLENPVLKGMLRTHSAGDSLNALCLARENGFDNLNADLILGYPHQTASAFLQGLQHLIDFHPQHFSIYLLEVHEKTGLFRQIQMEKVRLMPESEQLTCFETAVSILKEAGYEHYEVSNFALPGYVSRHNLKYWTDVPYYAYGAGACSYSGTVRRKNAGDVARYIDAMEREASVVEEEITQDREMCARNALIFGLRKTNGIVISAFRTRYGIDPITLFENSAADYLDSGLLAVEADRLRLTFQGMLLSNEILSSAV